MPLGLKHLARMTVERDSHRQHTIPMGVVAQTTQQELVAAVNAVEEADGRCHRCLRPGVFTYI